jgi:hypothetical protein
MSFATLLRIGLTMAIVAAATPVVAQTDEERALALLAEAKELREHGRIEQACQRIEESVGLSRSAAALFDLADCREASGRLATAWRLFTEAVELAHATGDADRERGASDRAAALAPRLMRLQVRVSGAAPNLEVEVDDEPLPRASWGEALPVDPGRHRVAASAPGRESWEAVVQPRREGETLLVMVPPLPAPEVPLERPPDVAVEQDDGSTQRIVAIVLGSVALASIAVGAGCGILAIDNASEYKDHCDAQNRCDPDGIDLHDKAKTFATASNATFVVGGVTAVAGFVVWLTAPSADRGVATLPSGAALDLGFAF